MWDFGGKVVIVKPIIHLAAVRALPSAGLHNFVLGCFGGGRDGGVGAKG